MWLRAAGAEQPRTGSPPRSPTVEPATPSSSPLRPMAHGPRLTPAVMREELEDIVAQRLLYPPDRPGTVEDGAMRMFPGENLYFLFTEMKRLQAQLRV